MKKLLATTALVAALFAGAQGAQASVIVTGSLVDVTNTNLAADATACSTVFGSTLVGNTCNFNLPNGFFTPNFTFGAFQMNNYTFGSASPTAPALPEPNVWLDGTSVSLGVAGTVKVSLLVQGYTTPDAGGALLLSPSGTMGDGMSQVAEAFINGVSVYNSGLKTGGWGTNLEVSVPTNPYSFEWVSTLISDGSAIAPNGPKLEAKATPTPTPLSLLGFGLVALAYVTRRRRGFQN